ncbi:MAG TPA: AraC family transcriptional regulator [Spongiibacteraceae bacterium]|nr:AraC family transcriptional regulator [Spongiibacteraceae bacterium]
MTIKPFRALALCSLLLASAFSAWAETETPAEELESLKKSVLALNRDLLILEEELLYPDSTQLVVFLSLDVGEFFSLDAVKLMVDDKLVASELYTERQVSALVRGGIQRLHLGNLKNGRHEISAFFTGKGPMGREYKRAATISVDKQDQPTVLELQIMDSEALEQPTFSIRHWQL